jgi:hypothetical protein
MQIFFATPRSKKSVATILVESTFLSFWELHQQMDDKTSKSEKETARNREAIDAAAPQLPRTNLRIVTGKFWVMDHLG